MLNIPNNPVKEFSVVSECYELLGATDSETNTENYFKNEWLLKRASSNAPLREARIRSFKPLTRLTPYHVIPTATITIRPYIFNYDPDYRFPTNEISNDYKLYNAFIFSQNIGDMEMKIANEKSYTINLTASLKTTTQNINNVLTEYFRQFVQEDATFDFSNGSTIHNYISDYNQTCQGVEELISYSPPTGYTIQSMKPIRNGYFAYALSNDSSGTTTAICICKPQELASQTLAPLSIASSGEDIVGGASDKSDCSGHSVIITPHYLIQLDKRTNTITYKSSTTSNYNWFLCASNDREIMVSEKTVAGTFEVVSFLVQDWNVVQIDNTHMMSALCGFNDKFIFTTGSGSNCKFYITDKLFSSVQELEISDWVSGSNMTIHNLDVINGISGSYVIAYDDDHYKLYFIESTTIIDPETEQPTTSWKYNGVREIVSYNNQPPTHCQSSVISCANYNGYSQIWEYQKDNVSGGVKISEVQDGDGKLAVSGGWYGAIAANATKYIIINKEEDDAHVLTIDDYLNMFSFPLTQIDILRLHYDEEETQYDRIVYSHNLSIPLTEKLLIFNVEITTSPYALIYSRAMEEIINDIQNIDITNYYLNQKNYFISISEDYEEAYDLISSSSGNYYINLCSPHMNNISNIIYNTYTEANVVFKTIDSLPSANYLTVYLTRPDGTKPPIEELKNNFSAIYVEIDYIYEKV